MAKDVIIALDFKNGNEALGFLQELKVQIGRKLGESSESSYGREVIEKAQSPYVKVGMELFYSEGPSIIREIKNRGHKIFLDLKLHDIPNTVEKAMSVLSKLDIDMVNIHAAGTKAMMEAAIRGLTREDGTRPLLIAVTQLTSTDEDRMRRELLISESLEDTVVHYGRNAYESGLDGVVCSPLESSLIHEKIGTNFLTVTPGIRFQSKQTDDQVRIMTPEKAREIGSDYIVVGRPITSAQNFGEAYLRCLKDFIG